MAMAGASYFSFKESALDFFKEHPGTWGAYAAFQLVFSLSAVGVATVSYPKAFRRKRFLHI